MQANSLCLCKFLYLFPGILKIGTSVGPLIGFLLSTFCAKIYVDTGSVNTGKINFIYTI